jgi:hypothetical protein
MNGDCDTREARSDQTSSAGPLGIHSRAHGNWGLAGPYLSRAADRPQIACGLASAAMFQKGRTAQQGENLAPCFGLQFFGRVDIDGRSGIMTVTLKDVDDRALWSVDIEPRPDARPGRILAHHI